MNNINLKHSGNILVSVIRKISAMSPVYVKKFTKSNLPKSLAINDFNKLERKVTHLKPSPHFQCNKVEYRIEQNGNKSKCYAK